MNTSQSKMFHLWMTFLALLNGIDFFTTKAIVDKLGFDAEVNWVMWKLITETGTIYSVLVVKIVCIVGVWVLGHQRINQYGICVIKALCVIYMILAVWNFNGVYQIYF